MSKVQELVNAGVILSDATLSQAEKDVIESMDDDQIAMLKKMTADVKSKSGGRTVPPNIIV